MPNPMQVPLNESSTRHSEESRTQASALKIHSWEHWRPLHFISVIMAVYIISSFFWAPSSLFKRIGAEDAPLKTEIRMQRPEPASASAIRVSSTTKDPDIPHGPEWHRRRLFKWKQPACTFGRGRARTFLIVFNGHSGSSAITSELSTHPQVYMEARELIEKKEFHNNEWLALKTTREFFERGITEGKTPGFKIRPVHILRQPQKWAALAREFDTRIVWQYRRNVVKQAVGLYSNHYYNDSSSVMGLDRTEVKSRCEVGAGCSYAIDDFEFFHEMLMSMVASDAAIAHATYLLADGRDCIFDLPYEDYLYERDGTMKDLQTFLGLRYVDTRQKLFKATDDNMCSVVTNWNQLCMNFYGCRVWRAFFEDERNGCSCQFAYSPEKFCRTS